MPAKISIGTWAYLFNQETPTNDFHVILHKLQDLGYDGVELGGFNPHPGPDTYATKEKRAKLRKEVADHGLKFSALAADLWSQKLLTVDDSGPYIAAFAKNLFFAEDLGIDTIRVDTVEPITVVQQGQVTPEKAFERAANAFDMCSKIAAQRGMNICWEFEPGFAFNKPTRDRRSSWTRCGRRGTTRTSACCTTPATPTCAPRSGPTRSAARRRSPAARWSCSRSSRGRSPTST